MAQKIPYKEVSKYVNAADICIAYLTRKQNERIALSTLKIYECPICGRLVICARISGLEFIKGRDTGILEGKRSQKNLPML